MKKNIQPIALALALSLGFILESRAVTLYSNDFGTTAISGTSYTGNPTVVSGIANSLWTTSYSSGFTSYTGSEGTGSIALGLANSSGTPTITLTLTLDQNYTLDLTSITFWDQRSGTGAQSLTLSVNGTSVGSNSVPTSGSTTTITPSTTSFGGSSGLTIYTFVIGLSGATGSGTFRLDNFTINGTLTPAAVPEPSTVALSFGGIGLMLWTLRRKRVQS